MYINGGSGGASFGDDSQSTRMIAFDSDFLRFDTTSLERMRITSGGDIRIGSNSSGVRLAINGWSYNPGSDGSGCVGLKQTGASSYGYVVEAATNDSWMMMGHNGTNGIIETTYAASAGHSDLHIKTGSANVLTLQSSGGKVNIGAGTSITGFLTIEQSGNHIHLRNGSAASGKYWNFDVASNNRLYILNNGDTGVYISDGATSWTANSDETLKENIKPLNNVLDKIKDYRCVEYNFKSDKLKDKKIGFIAQDWENDFAPIINKDDEGLLGMKYTETIPVLLKAIQELKAEVDKLKQECKCKN